MAVPLDLGLRFDRRAHLTMLAIGLCVAYVAGGYAVAAAFQGTTQFLGDTFAAEIVVLPEDEADAASATFVYATQARFLGRAYTVVTMTGVASPRVSEGTALALPDAPFEEGAPLRLEGPSGSVSVVVAQAGGTFAGSRSWLIVAPETFARLDAPALETPLFAYSDPSGRDEPGSYGVPSVLAFFVRTGEEIARDVWLVLGFACVVVALVASEFTRLEIVTKRREIGIWRAIGLSKRGVLAVLLARVAIVASVGTLVGWFAALAGLSAVAGLSPGLAGVSESVLVSLPFASAFVVAAAVAGALPPALGAARAPLARLMEADA